MTPTVRYPAPVRAVRFLARPNRYVARVRDLSGGPAFLAHVPNPGRMEELLLPGLTRGYAIPAGAVGRRTHYDLVSVRHGRSLVSIDSRVGNRIGRQALAEGLLPRFGPGPWRSEAVWGSSRLDFAAGPDRGAPRALLEVKCSNLKVGSFALFPDAPTVRGTRHVLELARARRRGIRAGVLFVVQRDDTDSFAPNEALDPAFAHALRSAARAGVRIEAHAVRVRPDRVIWHRRLTVTLDPRRTSLIGAPAYSVYNERSATAVGRDPHTARRGTQGAPAAH
ncbi:MAG: DNA/RNA nuclease SfsA [Thermoplasmata archaeon]|nr:DNA/RNA nuclease SfsA [Thermoplasmata archaeon]